MPTRTAEFSATGLYQVLKADGSCMAGRDPGLSEGQALAMYRGMLLTRLMDQRMMNLQRQGRIGFYGMCFGQEAATVASAMAMEPRDWLFPALRELAAAIQRGMPLTQAVAQCIGNGIDVCRGRQMPCHPTWRAANHVSMSPVMATQLPQAAGAAHAVKIKRDDVVVVGYIGDGATSEADWHAALNWAGVYRLPLVVVCQNNGWAISVPLSRQTASETIAVKAVAYGIEGVRVDGNDALAVYAATRRAVERARAGEGATLVEAVTYRLGPHSSSDDPTRYRQDAEVEAWKAKDPLPRMRQYLEVRGVWDGARDAALQEELQDALTRAIDEAEKAPPPAPESLVGDVYRHVPRHLEDQLEEVLRTHSDS